MDEIQIDIDENNELLFNIQIEGSTSPAKIRLVCENSENLSYMFIGKQTTDNNVVQVNIPAMCGKITEGEYSARLEVLIENKLLTPINFQLNFKKQLSVFVESITTVSNVKNSHEIKSSASLIEIRKPQTLRDRINQKKQIK